MSTPARRLVAPLVSVIGLSLVYVALARWVAAADIVGELVAGKVALGAVGAVAVLVRLFLVLFAPAWLLYVIVVASLEAGRSKG